MIPKEVRRFIEELVDKKTNDKVAEILDKLANIETQLGEIKTEINIVKEGDNL